MGKTRRLNNKRDSFLSDNSLINENMYNDVDEKGFYIKYVNDKVLEQAKKEEDNDEICIDSPRPYLREFDFTDFVYTPHTLTALVIFLSCFLFVIRYYYYPQMSVVASVKLGLAASAFSFIVFGSVHLPDSQLVRPHPFIWRAVLACAIIYLALLSFLLFQNLETVRAIAGFYDPSLLKPLQEGQYAQDCRLSTREKPFLFVSTAFDVFILAHFLGYFIKTLLLRDWRVATVLSIGFEVIEVTFQHLLPNFKECWWDHLLLDAFLCNGGGTLLGIFVLRKLHAKEYNWVALRDIEGYKKKTVRIFGQLGPRSFDLYEWNIFYTPKRFLFFMMILLMMFIQELNCFTMKHILRMPPKHHLVILRLVLWAFVGMPSLREAYAYINTADQKSARIGTTAWVAITILILETIFIAKLALEGKYFQEQMPIYIALPWMIAIFLFMLWFVLFFGILSLKQRRKKQGVMYVLSNIIFYGCCGCIFALFVMGMPDLQIGRNLFEQLVAPYEQHLLFWR